MSALLCALVVERCGAQTNVAGVVVSEDGKPIQGVRCCISGWPQPSGGHTFYSGMQIYALTDEQGHFSIPIPRADPLVDLQFDLDGGQSFITRGAPPFSYVPKYAPVFLSKVRPADGPVKVIMGEGKVFKVRLVERSGEKLLPIAQADVELELSNEGWWYQCSKRTDDKGEIRFRVSQPVGGRSWMIQYAGKMLPVDYGQLKADSVLNVEISVKQTLSSEPSEAASSR